MLRHKTAKSGMIMNFKIKFYKKRNNYRKDNSEINRKEMTSVRNNFKQLICKKKYNYEKNETKKLEDLKYKRILEFSKKKKHKKTHVFANQNQTSALIISPYILKQSITLSLHFSNLMKTSYVLMRDI